MEGESLHSTIWNVRGINTIKKQLDVKHFTSELVVGVVGLLETKVKPSNLGRLYQRIFNGWCFTSNSSFHEGGRIIVALKASSFKVNILGGSSQYLHCYLEPRSGKPGFYCTLIYAFNETVKREELWKDLMTMQISDPWIICGDFNCVMNTEKRIGAPMRDREMKEIRKCMVHYCEMQDLKSTGQFFTWNNKQVGHNRVFFELDRIMANPA